MLLSDCCGGEGGFCRERGLVMRASQYEFDLTSCELHTRAAKLCGGHSQAAMLG